MEKSYTENLARPAGMLDAATMMIKLTLELTLPPDANVLEVVYLLKAAREIAVAIWPGATLRSRHLVVPCKKSALPRTMKAITTG